LNYGLNDRQLGLHGYAPKWVFFQGGSIDTEAALKPFGKSMSLKQVFLP